VARIFLAEVLLVQRGVLVHDVHERRALRPHRLLFLPIAWAVERFVNGLWHVWWVVHFREYSPGLVTSVLFWMQSYFVLFCRPQETQLDWQSVWPGLVLGLAASAFLSFYIPVIANRRSQRLHREA
jgi:hypothetical protein